MLIRTSITIGKPADELFQSLLDLNFVASCLPGAHLDPDVTEDGVRMGTVDVDMGVMRFRYGGTVKPVESDTEQRRAVFAASAAETGGDSTARATMSLAVDPCGEGSELVVETDLHVAGPVALLGRGLIEDFAQQIMEDFGRALQNGGTSETAREPGERTAPRFRALPFLGRYVKRRFARAFKHLARKPRRAKAGSAGPTVDLLVVGSGSGGLTAAIAAHDAGLRVLIVEKSPVVGGGTAYSGGVVWAPCNHVMRKKGIADSAEEALHYLAQASGTRGDAALAQRYVATVGPLIEQIQQWTGIPWIIWTGQPDYYSDLPGASQNGRAILQHPASAHAVLEPLEASMPRLREVRLTPHMDLVPGFQRADRPARESWVAGRAIIGGLWKAVLERSIPYRLSNALVDLVSENGRVVGGIVEDSDGHRQVIRAEGGVLLNTGGFDWNQAMAQRYLPGPVTMPQTPPSNFGDGHRLAMAQGAAVALMDKAVLHPAIRIPGELNDGEPLYRMFNAELAKPHGILVNRWGKRFAAETAYFGVCEAWNTVDQRHRDYVNVPSYLIVDSQFRAKYGLPGVGLHDPVPSWIHEADTIAELAGKIGVDVAGLESEVATYNRDCASGQDSRFERGATAYERYWGDPDQAPNPTMGSIDQAPYYAFEVHPSHAGTRGGVVITPDAEVTRPNGSVIEGLFACGNTAANLLFGAGYASGAAVGSSMVFGYLAAQKVIAG
ncbi:MAG: FAD-dependent oxidoreductase [Sphingomonas sp.]